MEVNKDYKGMIYAVGFAYGTSSNDTHYVNIIVGKENATIRSYYSVFCDDEYAQKLGIDVDALDYPSKGERQKRVVFTKTDPQDDKKVIRDPKPLFEGVLATVTHAPVQINGRTMRTLTVVVADGEQSLDTVVQNAVQRRFDNVDAKFFCKDDCIKDYKDFVLPEAVDRELTIKWLTEPDD